MALVHNPKWSFLLATASLVGGVALAARWHGGGESADADAVPAALAHGPGDAQPLVVVVELATPGSKVDVGLRRVGINPDSLAAAGVSSAAFGTLLQLTDEWFGSNSTMLSEADAAYGEARKTRDTLQRVVRSGLATSEQVTELSAAKADFESADASRAAVLDSLFSAAIAELSNPQVTALTQIRANEQWRKLPVHYLVEEREQASWVALRNALANQRIAPEFGDEPDPASQAFLSQVESSGPVTQASANLGTYLASIDASWNASLH